MAEAIGSLYAEMSANSAQFGADMKKARDAVKMTGASMTQSFEAIRKSSGEAVGSILSLQNVLRVAAVAGLAAFVKRSLEAADAIGDTAQAIGITATELQELRYAAQIAGVGSEVLTASMGQFVKRVGEATSGTGEARDAFAKLGISLSDVKARAPVEVLRLVADRIKSIEDPTRRAAILADLFGRSGVVMGNMLVLGSKGIDALREQAHKMGLVMDDDVINRAGLATDAMDQMKFALAAAGSTLAVEFLPVIQKLSAVFTSEEFHKGIKTVAQNMGDFIAYLVENADTIERVVTAFAGMRVGAALGGIAGGKGRLVGGIAGAAGGWFLPDMLANNGDHPSLVITPGGTGSAPGGRRDPATAAASWGLGGGGARQETEGAKEALDAFNKSQAKSIDQWGEWEEKAASALKGFVADMRNGASAVEALHNVLMKLVDDLLNNGLDAITKAIFSAFGGGGGLFSTFSPANTNFSAGGGGASMAALGQLSGARASGGRVDAGGLYMVGERGRELFRPSVGGQIIPNSALGGSRGKTEVVINNAPGYEAQQTTTGGPNGERVVIDIVKRGMASGAFDGVNRARFGLGPSKKQF